jgi:uncharacterized protein CbrC (UPF0167 family)
MNEDREKEIDDLKEQLKELQNDHEHLAWRIRCIENRLDCLENGYEE